MCTDEVQAGVLISHLNGRVVSITRYHLSLAAATRFNPCHGGATCLYKFLAHIFMIEQEKNKITV